jgi:hypothetical protein
MIRKSLFLLLIILMTTIIVKAAEEPDPLKESYLNQRELIDKHIFQIEKEQLQLLDEWQKLINSFAPAFQSKAEINRNFDKQDNIKRRMDENKKEINELKLKREELNTKVIEKYGTVPEWWKEDKSK